MSGKKNYVCEYCGKGVQYAHKVSHAKNRTKTIKKPNLRVMRVVEDGKVVKRRLCMKCLKSTERPHKDSEGNIRVVVAKKEEK